MKKWAFCIFLIISTHLIAQNDLSTVAILQPSSGCELGSNQNVTLRIFNFGNTLPAGTSFNVSYVINGGPPVTEMIILGTNLLSNSFINYTFTTQANLATPTTYIFDASCSLAGDINPTNNNFTGYTVINQSQTAGGILSGDTIVCGPINSGSLILSAHNGSITHWETSTNGGISWSILSNTSPTQGYVDLAGTTHYRVLVQNTPCAAQYSSIATVYFPDINLFAGNDTTVCMGDSVILTATGASAYVWSDGVIDGVPFMPSITHTYTVTAQDLITGCNDSDMVVVEVNVPSAVNLGNDFVLNAYEAILNAGGGFSSYLWNDLSTNQTLLTNSSGVYWVTVTDANGCASSDTISIVLTASAPVETNQELKLYPNPGGNEVCVEFINWNTKGIKITLTDLLSNIIECRQSMLAGSWTESFQLQNLVPGIYLFYVSDGISSKSFRWIKSQ